MKTNVFTFFTIIFFLVSILLALLPIKSWDEYPYKEIEVASDMILPKETVKDKKQVTVHYIQSYYLLSFILFFSAVFTATKAFGDNDKKIPVNKE